MALHILLVVVVACKLSPDVQSIRASHGISHEVQSFGKSEHVAADDEELLACVVVETRDRLVIQGKDKAFWDYYYTKGDYLTTLTILDHQNVMAALMLSKGPQQSLVSLSHRNPRPRSIKCKTYRPPPKPSSTLRNLTHPSLPEDLIGLIASFEDSVVRCRTCGLVNFKMKFLDRCSTPSTVEEFEMVNKQVKKEGGFCKVARYMPSPVGEKIMWRHGSLPGCMKHNSDHESLKDTRRFAACEMEPDSDTEKFIRQRFAREKEMLGLQQVIDERSQDTINMQHIFEGL